MKLHLLPFLLLAVLNISEVQGACMEMSGEEAMLSLRKMLECPNPEMAPKTCPCAGHREPKVPCAADQKALWEANWTGAAKDCIVVTPDAADDWSKHEFHYPSNFGSTCDQSGHDPGSYHCTFVPGKEDSHEFAHGPNYNSAWDSQGWCTDQFCWVDPCNCDALDIGASSWLKGNFYSYSACGSPDQYTAASCTEVMDMKGCVETSGCKWVSEKEDKLEGDMNKSSMPTKYGRPTYHEHAKGYAAKWSRKWGKSWTAAKATELKRRPPRAPRAPRGAPQPPRHPRPPAPPHKWYGDLVEKKDGGLEKKDADLGEMMPRRLEDQASESVLV